MGEWENLPAELLSQLYSFLPRRDRLSCSLVCQQWKDALDNIMLWKTMLVYIDTDLMEPSTIMLTRDYCKYVKNLEFGWAIPCRNKWPPGKYKEVTKRAVRFFLILYDSYIQLHTLRIFNWFDFMSFQKITYHLYRFLRNQLSLTSIIFDNINIQSANCSKLLNACLGSRMNITHLDLKGCYYCQSNFDAVYFRSCVEQLPCLKTFKLDYFILSCKLIDSILVSRNKCLENLEVILKETSWSNRTINDNQWCMLTTACPNLRVTFIIRNIYHYGDLRHFLKESIPLVSLSIALPRLLDRGGKCNFRKTLNLLVIYYHNTLETIDLHIKNENEVLDDVLLTMLRRCSKVKSFVFNGIVECPQVLKNAYQNMTCFCMATNAIPEKRLIFSKIVNEDLNEWTHRRAQFTVVKRDNDAVYDLLFLN